MARTAFPDIASSSVHVVRIVFISMVPYRSPHRLQTCFGVQAAVLLPYFIWRLRNNVPFSSTLLAAILFAMAPLPLLASSAVVISQVYGGGAAAVLPYYKDFIELFNPTPIRPA